MGSTWKKVKVALEMHLCIYSPKTLDDASPTNESAGRSLEAATASKSSEALNCQPLMPTTLMHTSSGRRISKSGVLSSKKMCAICLSSMKSGHGLALFTAECSHTFHFHCIAENVRHGHKVCPVCRTKWKEIPFRGPRSSELPHVRARVNPVNWPLDDGYMTILRRLPRGNFSNRHQHHLAPLFHPSDPSVFDDDEPLDMQPGTSKAPHHGSFGTVDIKTYPEFSAISCSASQDNFAILIHLKAPHACAKPVPGGNSRTDSLVPQTSRAPVDLVTVLDISGSMAGTKLALLKRAMGFVIQSLGPSDRLSVIAFSSTARRLFHLRRMSEAGRQHALQAVNSLVSGGGTNIAEGLRKGAKVIEERKEENPVCSIILLSDGQDTYVVSSLASGAHHEQPDYRSLVPPSLLAGAGHPVPVHAFGFGADHDSVSMHSISEASGGTFSFIEAEGVIQDAFAQCIGGLLSVVVQEMCVGLDCVYPGVRLAPIKSGSYASLVADDGRTGSIDVGDLYADEERDFLVSVSVPPGGSVLLKVGCVYRDPVSKETVSLKGEEVRIQRPELVVARTMSIEVDRERNRVEAVEDMAGARAAAERGALGEAVSVLEERRRMLSDSLAGRSGDWLCATLDEDLREMQERMASRQRYEASGRAYVLSGLSSHSLQRATARGDFTETTAYQTQSMADMVHRSQTLSLPRHRSGPLVGSAVSFLESPQPR